MGDFASDRARIGCPDPNAEVTHEHTYDDRKPPPPIQIVVQNPDGEVLLGEDSTRVLPACPSQPGSQEGNSSSLRELEALQRERQNDINGLYSLCMRRRKAASFFLCLDIMYMMLVAIRFFFNEGREEWTPVRIGTVVLACTAAVADVLCVIWLASSLNSKRTLVAIGVAQLLCCLGSAALLTGSTLILDFIRCLAIVQIMRAWAAMREVQRLPTLPYRLPATPSSWRERLHYRLVGQRPPFYMGPRRADPAPPARRPAPATPHDAGSDSADDSEFHSPGTPSSHAGTDTPNAPASSEQHAQDSASAVPSSDVELQTQQRPAV